LGICFRDYCNFEWPRLLVVCFLGLEEELASRSYRLWTEITSKAKLSSRKRISPILLTKTRVWPSWWCRWPGHSNESNPNFYILPSFRCFFKYFPDLQYQFRELYKLIHCSPPGIILLISQRDLSGSGNYFLPLNFWNNPLHPALPRLIGNIWTLAIRVRESHRFRPPAVLSTGYHFAEIYTRRFFVTVNNKWTFEKNASHIATPRVSFWTLCGPSTYKSAPKRTPQASHHFTLRAFLTFRARSAGPVPLINFCPSGNIAIAI